ncbi:hypothetical protein [Breznakia pachnodae]|uniref:Abi family protein n=1 Tax=Breznakia pachnodae TaxID=265178 RepID=A0ABU0DZC2_9FIRM|nr:hypothetical protein [Breznakia pachnodae]MDQ0359984.1 hypothetical protein [Breznakia pachnodae]
MATDLEIVNEINKLKMQLTQEDISFLLKDRNLYSRLSYYLYEYYWYLNNPTNDSTNWRLAINKDIHHLTALDQLKYYLSLKK